MPEWIQESNLLYILNDEPHGNLI